MTNPSKRKSPPNRSRSAKGHDRLTPSQLRRRNLQKKQLRKAAAKIGDLPSDPFSEADSVVAILKLTQRLFDNSTDRLVQVSREAYYQVLSDVYSALHAFRRLKRQDREGLLKELSDWNKTNGTKVTGFDPYRLFLRSLIAYPVDQAIARRKLSRDAKAIQYAERLEIAPNEFLTRIALGGHGKLDSWARLEMTHSAKERGAKAASKFKASAASVSTAAPTQSPRPAQPKLANIAALAGKSLSRAGSYAGLIWLDADGTVTVKQARWLREDSDDDLDAEALSAAIRTTMTNGGPPTGRERP